MVLCLGSMLSLLGVMSLGLICVSLCLVLGNLGLLMFQFRLRVVHSSLRGMLRSRSLVGSSCSHFCSSLGCCGTSLRHLSELRHVLQRSHILINFERTCNCAHHSHHGENLGRLHHDSFPCLLSRDSPC